MALGIFWASLSLVIFIGILTIDKMGFFGKKNRFPVTGRTVLVTGGSQGMGKGLAQLLASKGANVIIVARNVKTLEQALGEIRASAVDPTSQKFHYISADLTSSTDSTRVLAESTQWNDQKTPDIVICCAGASRPDYFVTCPTSTFKDHMETNYLSAAYIAQASARIWLDKTDKSRTPSSAIEPKHIVFVSSLAAFAPIPGYAPYAPAKTAIRCLSEQLSQEFLLYEHHTPMLSHCVYANTMLTPGLETENLTKPEITKIFEEGDSAHTPESAARVTMQALEKGHENITIDGMLGWAMRSASLGFSHRNGLGILDTMLSAIVTPVLPLVRRDFESKTRAYGKKKF